MINTYSWKYFWSIVALITSVTAIILFFQLGRQKKQLINISTFSKEEFERQYEEIDGEYLKLDLQELTGKLEQLELAAIIYERIDLLPRLMINRSHAYWELGKNDMAISVLLELLREVDILSSEQKIEAYRRVAKMYQFRQYIPSNVDKARSAYYINKAMELAEEIDLDKEFKKDLFKSKVQCYRSMDYDSTIQLIKIGQKKYPDDADFLLFRALAERHVGNHELEYEFIEKYKNNSNNENTGNPFSWSQYGVSCRNAGKYEIAEEVLLPLFDTTDASVLNAQMIAGINVGKLYLLTKENDRAEFYLNHALKSARNRNSEYYSQEALDNLIQLYKNTKDYEKLVEAVELNKLIIREAAKTSRAEFYEGLLHSDQVHELKQKTDYRSFLFKFFLVFVILSIILLLIILVKSRRQWKEAEMKKQTIEKHVLEKNRNLTEMAVVLESKNRVLFELQKKLGDLKADEIEGGELIERFNHMIKIAIDQGDGTLDFMNNFNLSYPDFFKRLLDMNKNLTQLDLKHAAFIRLNLSNIEVSKIMGIEAKSVREFRYRLKKKLNLGKDEKLSSFLLGLTNNH